MELYQPYKWPSKLVSGVVSLGNGVITLLTTTRGPFCSNLDAIVRSAARSAAKKEATTGPFSKLEKSQEEQVKVT